MIKNKDNKLNSYPSQNSSSFALWFRLIPQWRAQYALFLSCILVHIPFALAVLVLVPYCIKILYTEPNFIFWKNLIGEHATRWITSLVRGTDFQNGISISFQKDYFAYILLFCALIFVISNFLSEFLIKDLGEKLASFLRKNICQKFLTLNYSESVHVDSGYLVSMLSEDTREAQHAFSRSVGSVVRDSLLAIVLLAWLVILDTQLFVLFFVVILPATVILRVTGKILKKLARSSVYLEGELLNSLLEITKGWQTIKIHKAEKFELKKFNTINESFLNIWRRAARAKSLGTPLIEWLAVIAGATILIVALRRLSEQGLANSVLISFFVTVGFLANKLNNLSMQINDNRKGTEALRKILKFLNTKFKTNDSVLDISKNDSMTIENLSLKDLKLFDSNGNPLLDNVNVELKQGDIFAIVGPSGVGKSTLIRCLLGLHENYQGEILINGERLSESLLKKISAKIDFVPQEPFLFSASCLENIIYPRALTDLSPQDREDAQRYFSQMNFTKDISDSVMNLSGGEKQRLLFARLLFKNPNLVIIDEGTSSLDQQNEDTVFEYLNKIRAKAIIIFVSHRLSIKKHATHTLDFKSSELTSQRF